ncbi:MAG: hypothetical protein K9M57_03950 [Phycisphaerae bacterium]|nr:hypothetical protein [Phycisphaerae bacterium]
MKHVFLTLMGISVLVLAGCGDTCKKQLSQSQQDNVVLQEKLTKNEADLTQERKGANAILENLMTDLVKKKKAIEELEGKIKSLTTEITTLKSTNKDIMTKTQRAMMTQIGENRTLKAKLLQAEKDLAEMTNKVKELSDAAAAKAAADADAAKDATEDATEDSDSDADKDAN